MVVGAGSTRTFFIEVFAVWTFAAYWVAKSLEMRETGAERLAAEGRAFRDKVPKRASPDDAAIKAL